MAGSVSSRLGSGRMALLIVAGAGLLAMAVAFLLSRSLSPVDAAADQPVVHIVQGTAPTVLPPPAADPVAAHGAVIRYELLGISGGTALIAPHGGPPRSFRAGDQLSAGVHVAEVRRGSVLLREGDRVRRLSLPPRLGGSGEPVPAGQEGLQPTPQPPTGELSAEIIEQRMAAAAPSPLPGEEAPSPN